MKNYLAHHLTTEDRMNKYDQVPEPSEESEGQSSWILFVGRTCSRQTMRWNSEFVAVEKL